MTSKASFWIRSGSVRAVRKRGQGGGALFIALMLLIVISILGLAAARVTALQERMAGAYVADSRAFERGEDRLRDEERLFLTRDPDQLCYGDDPDEDPVPGEWVDGTEEDPATVTLNLNDERSSGVGGTAQTQPREPGGPGCQFFMVSVLEFSDESRSSRAVIQSAFIP